MNTIRTMTEIEISKELEHAFIENLRGELAGEYERGDIQYTAAIIADVEKHIPECWQPDTKKEFVRFLTACAELYIESTKK